MTGDEGLVYELHFDQPIGDPENPKGSAQHYIGHTEDLDRRLAEHRGGHTAAIMRAVNEAGIGWHLVRTWPGTRDTERQIKNLRSGRRLCPECTEHPLTGAGAVARAAALRRHREAQAARAQRQEARLETQRADQAPQREAARAAAEADPYEDGRRMARQWLARQDEAGRTADQIEATHEYVTGPWAEMAHRTEAETDRYRGYTELVRAALAEFREYEGGAGPVPQHDMEAEAGPTGPAGNEMEEQMQEYDADGNATESADYDAGQYEHDPGSWLARDGDSRVLEVDAEGHPGREASPDDRRPVAEAQLEQARSDAAATEVAVTWGAAGRAWEAARGGRGTAEYAREVEQEATAMQRDYAERFAWPPSGLEQGRQQRAAEREAEAG
jgi:putative endonuclease